VWAPLQDEGTGAKKKKKKGKKGKDEKEEEDIDALLAELEGPKKEEPAASAGPAPVAEEAGPSKAEGTEAGPAEGDEKEGDEGLSAAAKKRKKKKEKEKEKKSADKVSFGWGPRLL
jgi:translation initiation factor 5B